MPQSQSMYPQTSKDTVPPSDTLSGTWTAGAGSKFLYGTSGAALSQVQRGWWIYDNTNDEIRQIERVDSNNIIVLEQGFTNAQSADTLKRVASNGLRTVSVQAMGGDIEVIVGANTLSILEGKAFNREAINVYSGTGLINPFIVDPDSNQADIMFQL